jgi:endonuclease YncB( thermonuclease family)
MKRGFRAALLSVLGLVVPLSGYTVELFGRVVSSTDGETLVVLNSQRTQHKIRLAGIDAPKRPSPSASAPARTWRG